MIILKCDIRLVFSQFLNLKCEFSVNARTLAAVLNTCHCLVCLAFENNETSEYNVYKSAIQLSSVHSSCGSGVSAAKNFPWNRKVSLLAGYETFWRHLSSEIQLNRLSQCNINVTLILPYYFWIAKFSFFAFSLFSLFSKAYFIDHSSFLTSNYILYVLFFCTVFTIWRNLSQQFQF